MLKLRAGDAPVVELVETALSVTVAAWLMWAAGPFLRVFSIWTGVKEGLGVLAS